MKSHFQEAGLSLQWKWEVSITKIPSPTAHLYWDHQETLLYFSSPSLNAGLAGQFAGPRAKGKWGGFCLEIIKNFTMGDKKGIKPSSVQRTLCDCIEYMSMKPHLNGTFFPRKLTSSKYKVKSQQRVKSAVLSENGRKPIGKQIDKSKTLTRKCCHETLENCQTFTMKN